MALDNKRDARRPHSQEEFDEEKRALEDKIIHDSSMADKIYNQAMNKGRSAADEQTETDSQHTSAGYDSYDNQTAHASYDSYDNQTTSAGYGSYDNQTAPAGQATQSSETEAYGQTTNIYTSDDSAESSVEEPYHSPYYNDASTAGHTDNRYQKPRRAWQDDTDRDQKTRPAGNISGGGPGRSTGRSTDGRDAFASRRPGVRKLNTPEQSESEVAFERKQLNNKRKQKTHRIITMVVVELITLVFIFCGGFIYRYLHMTQTVEFDKNAVKNENIDITKQQTMKGYWTVAIFGVDSRDGGVGKGANADVQIIANINMETGDVKLASVFRDSYLSINKQGRYAKINEAYAAGGPEQAVAALNRNLDLDIENYMTFNWKAVADAITMIGGVDIDISKAEFYYMNAYIHETCIKSGINAKNPAAEYIKTTGMQHLDGVQAVAYARLRYMDSDFERTARQREVITQVLQKAKQTDLATLTKIIDTVLPQVAFNINTTDIIQLAKGIARYNITDTEGFPTKLKTQMMGKKGDCVIPTSLTTNVSLLHEFLFDDKDYDPSDAVKAYSNKIAEDSSYYENYSATEDASEYDKKYETTEAKKDKETEKETYETDEYGNYIIETDEDGNILETRKNPNKETTKASSKKETDKDGNVVKETDKYGNVIKATDENGDIVETTKANSKETLPEELETYPDGRPVETTKSENTKETTKASSKETTVAEPGANDRPGGDSPSETTKAEIIEAPGQTTEATNIEGPNNSGGTTIIEHPGMDLGGSNGNAPDSFEGPGD